MTAMHKAQQKAEKIPHATNPHSRRAAKHRTKEPNDERLSQMSSSIQVLAEIADICKDADVWSRIDENQRLAREVDEYYEHKLFVGEGKQAMKRCHEYMDMQLGISESLYEDINELTCRERIRNDIWLLTRMQTEDPKARIFAGTKSETRATERGGKAMPHDHISDQNAVLRNIMSSFLEAERRGRIKLKETRKEEAQAQSEAAPRSGEPAN
jgi:hypothetical protein